MSHPDQPPPAVSVQATGPAEWSSSPKATARARRACLARRHSGRRRFVDPATCDRAYSAAELEFMGAMQEYKRRSGRRFPTWSEVLEVVRGLGYEKAGREADR